jgi:PAS domain S-box-containing protein
MRAETKLRLSVVASLAICAGVFLSAFMILHDLDRVVGRRDMYQEIQSKIHALHVTATRLQGLSDPTALHQIGDLRRSLDLLLASMATADTKEAYFVELIRANAGDLGRSLENLIADAVGRDDPLAIQRQAMLSAQVWVKAQFISDDAQHLIGICQKRITEARRTANILIGSLVALLMVAIAAISYFTGRSILRMQKGLQQALAQAEQGDRLLAALMAYVPEGISIADGALNLVRVSRYGHELFGAPQTAATVASAHRQWNLRQADGTTPLPFEQLPLVRAARHGEVVTDFEIVGLDVHGKPIPLLCSAGPIRDADGAITGAIVAWRDITRIKQAEAQLLQARKMESIGRLAGGVAHDFNNKMSIILGNAELALASQGLPPAERLFLKEIQIGRASCRERVS